MLNCSILLVSLVRSTHHNKGLQSSAETTKTFWARHFHSGTTPYSKDAAQISTHLFTFTGQTRSRPDLIRVKDVDTTNMYIVYVNSNQQNFCCTQSTDEALYSCVQNCPQMTSNVLKLLSRFQKPNSSNSLRKCSRERPSEVRSENWCVRTDHITQT